MTKPNNPGSLQDLINEKGDLVKYFFKRDAGATLPGKDGFDRSFHTPRVHELAR